MADETPPLEQALRLSLAGQTFERGPRPQDLTVRLGRPADLVDAAAKLDAAGLTLATLVATDDEATPDKDLKVRYVFEPRAGATPPVDTFVTLLVSLDPARPEVPSLTAAVPAANWHEREARDLFGITPLGHPDPRPLVLHDGWPAGLFPLRKRFDAATRPAREPATEFPHLVVEGEGVFEVPVGPIHAGIIEPGHFRFSTAGEAVLHLEARLFYTHRGLEKRAEGLSALDGLCVAERLCGVCALSHALGFCEAAEQIAAVEVPARARVIRTVALELERLYNHVGDIGNIGAGVGYHYGTSVGARMKEALQRLCERLAGNRFLRGLLTPGGVLHDVSPALAGELEQALSSTASELAALLDRIENNSTVIDRLDGTGLLSQKVAIDLGVTGVAARASGVDRDARRDHPHGAYASGTAPEVRVVTASEGDVHARLNVRALEAAESIRLIRELLSDLPAGPLAVTFPAAMPAWGVGLCSVESPRGAAVHWLRSDEAGRIHRYHVRSASYANWPAVGLAALGAIIPAWCWVYMPRKIWVLSASR